MSRAGPIRSVAVLGAGTMGAQIAAHFANAGIPALLLDVTGDLAREGLKRASILRPDPFFTKAAAGLITTGSLEHDLDAIARVDWIIEAIVERLDVKRALFERIDAKRSSTAVVSSNTSGIPIAALAEGRSESFQKHFLGSHFFNPPRYLRLLEIIPTPATDAAVIDRVAWWADHRLGKGTVVAKDSPGFIANRIGLFGVAQAINALESGEYTIEEIDAITGPALGRPKSATFRTMDIAGIDVLRHVAIDLVERLPDEGSRQAFSPPPLVEALVGRGWLGEKSGQGFYKREGSEILTLDPATLTYRPKQSVRIASLESYANQELRQRVKSLFQADDKAGAFLRATLAPLLVYCAEIYPTIAHSLDDVDRAMQWGFGWSLGPFELWDAIGAEQVLAAAAPANVPALVADAMNRASCVRPSPSPPPSPGVLLLKSAKDRTGVLQKNSGASLIDLGDDVLAVELHSKLNTIGGDVIQMLNAGVSEAARNFAALVVGTDAGDFSAGANLMLLLLEAQDGNWDEIDLMVRAFQQATAALRYAEVPVVTAPCGLTLGGGCEIAMYGASTQSAAETYIGLVEVGVGLIPAGGGVKELLARAMRPEAGVVPDALRAAQSVFETIGFGKVSTSASHARELGYLREQDGLTMNRDRLIAEAKANALARARDGYQRQAPAPVPVGGESVEAALKLGVHLALRAGRISDHDATIGRALARVIAGGSLPHPATVPESHILDLEREAFLKMCGEPKTLERIRYTLKTGKMLRN